MPSRASPLSRLTYRRGGDEVGVDRAQASPSPSRTRPRRMHGNGLFQTRESAGAINRLLFSPSEAQFEAVPPGRPPRRAMAAAQGAPGASLVSLVTASLRNDRHLHARTPEEGETPPCAGRRDIFSSASASSFPRARPSVTASPSPTTTPAPGLPDRVHIASASSSDRRSVARGDAHVGPPGDDTRAAGAQARNQCTATSPASSRVAGTDPRTRSRCSATPPRTSAVTDWWR